MPSYLADKGFDSSVAAVSLSIIGLCNIAGSLAAGHLSGIYSKKWILAFIYGARSIVIVLFLVFPISLFSVYCILFCNRISLACDCSSNLRSGCTNVWSQVYGDTLWHCILKPSDWLIYRSMAWGLLV